MYMSEFFGIFVLSALVGMASVGGVGGGGITVPVVSLCWGFSMKESIAISGLTIFIGAVMRFYFGINKKHPEKKATQIDYSIVIVMLPLVIVGSVSGVLINVAVPPVYLSAALSFLLVFLVYQSTKSGMKIYKRETEQLANIKNDMT